MAAFPRPHTQRLLLKVGRCCAAALSLAALGGAAAQACPGLCTSTGGGTSTVVQLGTPNFALVMQSGPMDYSGVYQGGASNQAVVNQGGYAVQNTVFTPPAPSSSAALDWTFAVYAPDAKADDGRLVEPAADTLQGGEDLSSAPSCSAQEPAPDNSAPAALHACDDVAAKKARIIQIRDAEAPIHQRVSLRADRDISDLAVEPAAKPAAASIRLAAN